jgi:hypothetical protein
MTIFMLGHLLVSWVGEVGLGGGEGMGLIGGGGGELGWGGGHPILYGSSLCLPVGNLN